MYSRKCPHKAQSSLNLYYMFTTYMLACKQLLASPPRGFGGGVVQAGWDLAMRGRAHSRKGVGVTARPQAGQHADTKGRMGEIPSAVAFRVGVGTSSDKKCARKSIKSHFLVWLEMVSRTQPLRACVRVVCTHLR